MDELIQNIKNLAEDYSANLKGKIEARTEEMKADDNSHYLIYRVLGFPSMKVNLLINIKIRDDFYISMQVHFLKKLQLYV